MPQKSEMECGECSSLNCDHIVRCPYLTSVLDPNKA